MKKHGLIWWLFIGWWWWLFFGWWIAPLSWVVKSLAKVANQPKAVPVADQREEKNVEYHRVAGVNYRTDAVKALGEKNPDYKKTKKQLLAADLVGRTVYEYKFEPAKVDLVPEPENPHDPKAIKVVIEGRHIGYIKAGSCAHIHKLLKDDLIASATCKIGGGRYKCLTFLGAVEDEHGIQYDYELESDEIPFGARIAIHKKTE